MERFLRRRLEAIARDRRSGAAELALRAVAELRGWRRRRAEPARDELLEIARAVAQAQPEMAPLIRLANEVALAMDARQPAQFLAHRLAALAKVIRTGPDEIARRFSQSLRRGRQRVLETHSYSSTIVKAFRRARPRLWWALCSESRPGLEGRRTAAALRRAGIGVAVVIDAALPKYMAYADAIVVGADALCDGGFVNKVGTRAFVTQALAEKKPVWVLADTSKLLPRPLEWQGRLRGGPPEEVWPNRPENIAILNLYFETTAYRKGILILTERGWMTPARMRRELRKIQVSPRMKALMSPDD